MDRPTNLDIYLFLKKPSVYHNWVVIYHIPILFQIIITSSQNDDDYADQVNGDDNDGDDWVMMIMVTYWRRWSGCGIKFYKDIGDDDDDEDDNDDQKIRSDAFIILIK